MKRIDTEEKLELIFAYIHETYTETNQAHIELGIWDYDEDPPTFYAVIKPQAQFKTAVLGETSYGSISLDYAISALLEEIAFETTPPPAL